MTGTHKAWSYLDGGEFERRKRQLGVVTDEAGLRLEVVSVQLHEGGQGGVEAAVGVPGQQLRLAAQYGHGQLQALQHLGDRVGGDGYIDSTQYSGKGISNSKLVHLQNRMNIRLITDNFPKLLIIFHSART